MLPYDIFLEKIQKSGNIVFSFDPNLHWGNFSVFSTVSHDSEQIPICFLWHFFQSLRTAW